MYYVALLLIWLSGVVCGVVLAMVLQEYFRLQPGSLPEVDAHDRSTWPVERGR
jgi:hypothetical protein